MNRFIVIHLADGQTSFDAAIERARQMHVTPGGNTGFELERVTQKKAILRWFEKIVTERRVEDDPFGATSYFEVKIVTFTLIIANSMRRVILVDPPIGKHRVLSVLRTLFPQGKFIFPFVQIRKTIDTFLNSKAASVLAIETEPIAVAPQISMSMTVTGYGDVIKYLTEHYAKHSHIWKSAQVEMVRHNGTTTKVTVGATGLIKFADDVSYDDIELLCDKIVFAQ